MSFCKKYKHIGHILVTFTTVIFLTEGIGKCQAANAQNVLSALSPNQWDNIRLPKDLKPVEYDVDLRPILEPNEDGEYLFEGSSSVTYICKVSTNLVILHSSKLRYDDDQVAIRNQVGEEVAIRSVSFHVENELVIVETEEKCVESELYTLSVSEFVSELEADLTGLYRSHYYTKSHGKRIMATSLMAATEARETFPCFDEPGFKANFTITLWYKANSGYFAISNMPAASYHEKMIDGVLWNSTTFDETLPISTYLLAMVVCDFPYVESFTKSKIQTRIFARNESVGNGEALYASNIAPRILDFYEEYFSIDYPLAKSDQFAAPDFAAVAMENWGLVIYEEKNLLYKKSTSSIFNKVRVTAVIAHELAHQWFGNLVSPLWWDDIWLNEGFATYIAYLGMSEVQPTWKSKERFLLDDLHKAFKVDALTSTHPLVQSVNTPNEILSQFDTISYSKGASILRMVNAFMGQENFVRGLTNYLNDLAYGSATHQDLFRHWEEVSVGLEFPTNISNILETWTLQMGYPVLNVIKLQSPNNVFSVTQEYFLLDSSATRVDTPGSEMFGYQWYIPFTYKTPDQIGTDEVTQKWLEPYALSPIIIEESEYILGNIDAVGYYRVNYDESTWYKLSEQLRSSGFKNISTENRAQLLNDAFTLVSSGHLDIIVALDLTRYLSNEDQYVPWKTFLASISSLDHLLGRSYVYGTFRRYMLKVISPLYNSNSWKERNRTDSALIERMKKQLGIQTACYYGNTDCSEKASRLYARWMKNSNKSRIISNTYRKDIYCTAIRNGGVKEWDFAWEQHSESENAQEKESLRYGMSCSKEPWILSRYMLYCLNTNVVREADGLTTCLQYIADSEYGRDIVWERMVEHWDTLLENYGRGNPFFVSLIEVATNRFSTTYDLKKLLQFKENHENLGSAARVFDQAIEKTKINIRWRQMNEIKVANWMEKYMNMAE